MDNKNELLSYLYENAQMGMHALKKLDQALDGKNNKIRKELAREQKEYEDFLNKIIKCADKHEIDIKNAPLMAKMSSSMNINMEVSNDNSDAKIAHMLIEGFTIGIVDITSKIKNYDTAADKNVLKLAKDYLKYIEEEKEKLENYL